MKKQIINRNFLMSNHYEDNSKNIALCSKILFRLQV